jgi:hypothetical protein
MGTNVSFQFRNEQFSARSRKVPPVAGRGGVPRYVAQASSQFDAEIAEKGHLWMETNYGFHSLLHYVCQ